MNDPSRHGGVDFSSPALVSLGRLLREHGYVFTAVTPKTHATVLRRNADSARTLRDVFGWNQPFEPARFSVASELLTAAGAIMRGADGRMRSAVRFATLEDHIFVHSAFPTLGADSVFFGPDTYRFARAIRTLASERPLGRVVDVGAGSGAGGIVAAPHASAVVLGDVNADALAAARTNLVVNGVDAAVVESNILTGVHGVVDTVIANPPFLADPLGRAYRDGGGTLGTRLAARIAEEALDRLRSGGRLLLYSGAPIVEGRDVLADALSGLRRRGVRDWRYDEMDPDIFGEELSEPTYAAVERIAAIALTVTVA